MYNNENMKEISKISTEPYKQEEFAEFIKLIEGDAVEHWINIANALGVNKDTINRWKKLPEAKEAIEKGIRRSLEGMEKAGDKDWRMWESKLKMLGSSPVDKLDITSGGEKLPIMGGTADVQ